MKILKLKSLDVPLKETSVSVSNRVFHNLACPDLTDYTYSLKKKLTVFNLKLSPVQSTG